MAKKSTKSKKAVEEVEVEEEGSERLDYSGMTQKEKKAAIAEILAEGENMDADEKKAARVKLRKLGHSGGFGGRRAKAVEVEEEDEPAPKKKKPAKKKTTKGRRKTKAAPVEDEEGDED